MPFRLPLTLPLTAAALLVGSLGERFFRRRRSEQATVGRLTGILEEMTEICFAVDHEWRFTFVNRHCEGLFKLSREQLLGCTLWDACPRLLGTKVELHYRRAMSERQPVTFESFSPCAESWMDVRVFPSGSGIAAFLLDIRGRKEAEIALRASEERFRSVLDNIHEVFWMTDAAKREVLYISSGYEKIWERSCASLYAAPRSWLEIVHPDDRARVDQVTAPQASGTRYDITYRIVTPGGGLKWVRERAFPIASQSGARERIVGVAEDITAQKKLEDQVLRKHRLEAVGTLSNGIAHDLNNILAPMLMIGPVIRAKLDDPRDLELIDLVEQCAQRGASVIRQLLTFSRGVPGERGPVEIRHLMREMASIMRETFPREIVIVDSVQDGLWSAQGDATQLHQVLMNLCVNARDAMPAGGRLSLSAANVVIDEDGLVLQPEAKPGRYVLLTVSDTGEGIPAEHLAQIFEPFFTTKPLGNGTGLGLSIAMGIVKSHAGFISVYSEPGRGTVFKIHLPAIANPTHPRTPFTQKFPRGQGELVLVVDDEAAIRATVRQILEQFGYTVVVAANGREAEALLRERGEAIQVLFTDLMMPEMNGLALIRAARTFRPDLIVMAASGLQDPDRSAELASLGVNVILNKPFSPCAILEALTREIAAAAAPV